MKPSLQEQKSLLAKLMAAEDITVVHENIELPFFDLKERTLHCPLLKEDDLPVDILSALYDLFMSHEIGHALFTPLEGWHDAIFKCKDKKHLKTGHHEEECYDIKFQSFLNVCDDARIERKIKEKFPGLRTPYNIAYKNLYDRDFFGIKGYSQKQVDGLPLIDKINIFYKIGNCVMVNFTPEEQQYVDDLGDVDTFPEVIDIARRIYKFDKEQKTKNLDDLKNKLKQACSENCKNGQGGGNNNVQVIQGGQGTQPVLPGPDSLTDKIFREKEKGLKHQDSTISVSLPDVNMKEVIQKTQDVYTEWYTNCISFNKDVVLEVAKKAREFFVKKNKDYIEFLTQQFMMKKNAVDYARTRTFKTGELDGNLLNRYYFTNDIFKKMTVAPKGKSHGMVMFVDMSSSMHGDSIYFALDQIITLVSWCSKLSIPFDVYGFADCGVTAKATVFTNNKLAVRQFVLRHLISSSDPAYQQKKSMEMISCMALSALIRSGMKHPLQKLYGSALPIPQDPNILPQWIGPWGMSGTPFCSAVVAARHIIEKFKEKSRVDIINTIYLSDGAGGDSGVNGRGSYRSYSRYHISDKKTKEWVICDHENFQGALVELVQKITGTRHIGFYICPDHVVNNMFQKFAKDEKRYAKFKRGKKRDEMPENTIARYGFAGIPSMGFHTYYYLSADNTIRAANLQASLQKKLPGSSPEFMEKQMVNNAIALRDSKKAQKLMLSLFVDEISNRL